MPLRFSRAFAMPSPQTFTIKPIRELLDRWLSPIIAADEDHIIVDPFARDSHFANYTNDLDLNTDAMFHYDALEFLSLLVETKVEADAVLLDPPYSPRQVKECYNGVGRDVTMQDTQTAMLYKSAKDRLDMVLKHGGIAVTCGWNSGGFGINRGYRMLEILMVNHGGGTQRYDCHRREEGRDGVPMSVYQ